MAGTVSAVSSVADLHATYGAHRGLTTVLLWAPWHPPSVNLTKVLDALAAEQHSVRFAKVNADVCPSIAASLGADQVPFVAFLGPDGKKIDSVGGVDPPKLVDKVKSLAGRTFARGAVNDAVAQEGDDLNVRLKRIVNFSPVMLFMKGSKDEPFCKFSKQCVAILNKHSVEYSTFDILQDEAVRQGLKDYSNWKTYPQLYIGGELIGGVDIIKEMDEDGSLVDAFPKDATEEPSEEDKLKALVNRAPVMLFMKGNPAGPKCGFSRKISELLTEKGIAFETFDILQDEDVRQGLKTYSNWPTFPQLYGAGRLVGGLDIVKELADDGLLESELGISKP